VTPADGLCSPFLELLPITGASISVFDDGGRQSTICASDAVAARIEELQFSLGEGPHWEALRTGKPTLVPNLTGAVHGHWPIFEAAVAELDVGALFAFPLSIGAVIVGVVDLYRESAGELGARALVTAASLAGTVAEPATRRAISSATDDDPQPEVPTPEMRREVHQATGILLVQLDLTATDAFFRLKAHAYTSGRTLQDVARDVVARRIDFRLMPE
jgi:hypothetical protein